MIIVSTNKGDFDFRTTDEVLKFIQSEAQEETDIWISGETAYPCLAI